MEQFGDQIFNFLSQYGYWAILPLMIVEGPVVTIIASIMASLGAFNWLVVLLFSVFGDIFGDIILYGIGHRYGMAFVKGPGKYLGITEESVLKMENYFIKHGGKTIFAVKSTIGLCWAAFTAAGIIRMDFRKFLKYSFYGGIVWSGFLVAMGYFYGYLWREISQFIDWIGWAISGFAVLTYILITLYKKHQSKTMFQKKK